MTAATADLFLDGRVTVRQPARGFRSGLDAVMLAAAVPARSGDEILELGAGVGVASLCLAVRAAGCKIVGAEIERDLADLANTNAQANAMASRVRFVTSDVFDLPRTLRKSFDHVLCNPPFHGDDGPRSAHAARRKATHDEGTLGQWLETGFKRTVSHGTFTAIIRADRLNEALAALPESGVSVFPLWPRKGSAAKRVILQAKKGARAPLTLLPGLVLHEGTGYTPEADAILRGRARIEIAIAT